MSAIFNQPVHCSGLAGFFTILQFHKVERDENYRQKLVLNLCGLVDPFSSCYRHWRPVSQETGDMGEGMEGGGGGQSSEKTGQWTMSRSSNNDTQYISHLRDFDTRKEPI